MGFWGFCTIATNLLVPERERESAAKSLNYSSLPCGMHAQLFDWMKEREKLSAPTYTSFFSVLGKAGRAERALYIFNELPVLDPVRSNVFVCNSILSTLVYNGKVDKALRLFEQMKVDGLQPDLITYSTVNSKYRHHFYTNHFSTSLQAHRLQLCSLLGVFSVVHK